MTAALTVHGPFLTLTGYGRHTREFVRELHRQGNERAWWRGHGIDPLDIAATLWARTNPLEPAEADIAGDTDLPSRIRAKLNANGASSPTGGKVRAQNDQTKPIAGRGAE